MSNLSEEDVKLRFITPALRKPIISYSKTVLFLWLSSKQKNLQHTTDAGLKQAMNYANILQLLFAFSSNGKKFIEHDLLMGNEKIILTSDHYNISKNMSPRYYQHIAIGKTFKPLQKVKKNFACNGYRHW